jgi:crossover junction endonuclease MUS81
MITLAIDNRETKLIDLIKDRDLDKYMQSITMTTLPLDIGDIHIQYQEKIWIFERKSVQDLIASIKDGRYKEQKARMLSSGNDITYIIEGDNITSTYNERHQKILSGVYLHTMYRDGIRVIFTKNLNDTCTFILTMCTKIIDNPGKFSEGEAKQYIDCVKLKNKKIENITPETCYLMQLSQIPGISTTIAKNIQENYPTMRELIKNLEESDDRIAMLCTIQKIGKEKASNILEYLKF